MVGHRERVVWMANPAVILYVCNEKQSLGIRFILAIAGYSVLVADNGHSAAESLRRYPVSLILADHSIPRATVEELSRTSKRLKPEVPIALLVPSFKGHRARNGVGDMILAREMDPQDLLAAIAEALSKLPAVRVV